MTQYCGKDCQQSHWSIHQIDCRSPLMKVSWRPSWIVEARQPSFIGVDEITGADFTTHGSRKYLWGNVPALDLLNIQQNEGSNFAKDIRLLFAGD